MVPSDDDIRLAAYHQWKRHGGDREDWHAAADHLKFWMNYREIALLHLNCKPKVMIGDRAKVCRFCRRGKRKTSFRKIAHSVPEFFGNRSIISKDECG
jgi:hypothetical protein